MKIVTPKLKKEIELRDWITGKEDELINRPILDVRFQIGTDGKGKGEISVAEAIEKSRNTAIEIVVVAIDGTKENILERIYALPKSDYKFVLNEIDKVVQGENFQPPISRQEDGIR